MRSQDQNPASARTVTCPAPQAHRGVHQRRHTQPAHQRPRRHQARIGDKRFVVEDHPQPVKPVRYSTHRKCLPIRGNSRCYLRPCSQVSEALPRICTPEHPNPSVDPGSERASTISGELHVGEFTAVSAGGWHSCGLRAGGTVACWGVPGHVEPPDGVAWVT